MEFEKYIESKVNAVLDADKKKGKRRDVKLLTAILSVLFSERCSPDRSVYDIQTRLSRQHGKMKPDTLEDNLKDFLAKMPTDEPFVKISSERPGVEIYDLNAVINPIGTVLSDRKRKPRNIYTLNDYYLRDYFGKDIEMRVPLHANIIDPTPDGLQVQIFEKLAEKGDRTASEKLIQMVAGDTNSGARMKAALALGRLHEMGAVEQLKKACNDPEESVRKAAKKALETLEKRTS